MPAQSLYFSGDGHVRVEFHVEIEAGGALSLNSRFAPRHDDEPLTLHEVADDLARAMEAKVRSHFADHRSTIREIRYRHDLKLITIRHLGNFGVPLIPDDTGRTE